jgi:hypothetical protein
MRTSLLYETHSRINPGVVSDYDTVFSVNGAFDPEVTGVGHQPRLFDQYSLVYGRYRVDAAHVRVLVRQRAAHGIVATLVPSNIGTQYAVADRPAELTRAVTSMLTGANQPTIEMKQTFLPHAIIGITRQQYQDEEDCSAAVAGTPSQQAYFHVHIFQPDGATVLDVDFTLIVRYDVTFYDRINPGVSVLAQLVELRREIEVHEADDRSSVVVPAPPPARALPARR